MKHIITAPDGNFHNVHVINTAALVVLQDNRLKTSTSTAGPGGKGRIGGTRTERTGGPEGSGDQEDQQDQDKEE